MTVNINEYKEKKALENEKKIEKKMNRIETLDYRALLFAGEHKPEDKLNVINSLNILGECLEEI